MQIGFKALEARFGIMLAQPLRVASVMAMVVCWKCSRGLS